MGYTHYFYRKEKLNAKGFNNVVNDLEKLIPVLQDIGIPLADGMGEETPVITLDLISFNGKQACGHPENKEVSIPWPADNAGGVGRSDEAVVGSWFAGSLLRTRTCGGDCSYETFWLPRELKEEEEPYNLRQPLKEGSDLFFACCKTAYRPYDIAVTAALIIAKRHLGEDIFVSSDGDAGDWFDGALLCQQNLGYGLDFKLDEHEEG